MARGREINARPVDAFTLVHMALGAVIGRAGVPALPALAITTVWENVEPALKGTFPEIFPGATRDRPLNKLGDNLGYLAGWYLGQRSRTRR